MITAKINERNKSETDTIDKTEFETDTLEKGYQFYFPLYSIRFSENIKKTIDYIIGFCVVDYGYRLKNNFVFQDNDIIRIEKEVDDNDILNFDGSDEHYYIVFASVKLGVKIHNMKKIIKRYDVICEFVKSYEKRYGKDARVKVHRDILLEVKNRKFDEKLFRGYIAIKSVLGKKDFVQITYERIGYGMRGYRSKSLFYEDKCNDTLPTARQLGILTNRLCKRGLIGSFTYKFRIKFYSTKYKGKKLKYYVLNSIALKKMLKEQNLSSAKNNDEISRLSLVKANVS